MIPTDTTTVIRLKGGVSRRQQLELHGGELTLRFPPVFARRTLTVPLVDVCVADAKASLDDDARVATLDTVQLLGGPNLRLLLQRPVRMPKVRWIAWLAGWFGPDLDFVSGAEVDVLDLRVKDPEGARDALAVAGAASTDDPAGWLRERRR